MGVEGIFKDEVENVYFNLVDNGEFVTLELVDENGNHVMCGNICNINKNSGRIIKCCNVNRELGFTLDSYGRVIVDQNQNITPETYQNYMFPHPIFFQMSKYTSSKHHA